MFDVLGWFAPVIVKVKVLLQQLREAKFSWDDLIPQDIEGIWEQWRSQLPVLSDKLIPLSHFPKDVHIASADLHGFSNASEATYAGVAYIHMVYSR